ncbi:hypothetical protein J6590_003521 [Homalodisca vitripennis]|nr:hypothetical protein J6590_003521 [Homalodisca vitripennis]
MFRYKRKGSVKNMCRAGGSAALIISYFWSHLGASVVNMNNINSCPDDKNDAADGPPPGPDPPGIPSREPGVTVTPQTA